MSLTLSVTQKAVLSVLPVDIKGNPAPLDGAPVWDASDPSLINVIPSIDGYSAVISARGGVGHVQVSVRADARMGPDVREIIGILEIELVPAEAATLGIVAGEPMEQDTTPDDSDDSDEPDAG